MRATNANLILRALESQRPNDRALMLPYAMQMLTIFCVTGRVIRDQNPRCDPIRAQHFCCEGNTLLSLTTLLLSRDNDIRDNRDQNAREDLRIKRTPGRSFPIGNSAFGERRSRFILIYNFQ